MELLYAVFKIPVAIAPPMPELSVPLTPSMKEVPASRTPQIPQQPSAQKLVRCESIREKKKVKSLCPPPPKYIELNFMWN